MDTSYRLSAPTISKACGTPVGVARHDQLEQALCRGCRLALAEGHQSQYMARLRLEAKSPPPPPRTGAWTQPLGELIRVLAEAIYESDKRMAKEIS